MNVIEKFISERRQSPLFHYTTPAGMLGILQENSIWARKRLSSERRG